jgi:translation initiation factor 2-alpha kinase 4
MFFEMCYPFRTAMERASILNALRLKTIEFPSNFPSELSTQREIVTWLLQHEPTLRPKAAQLLSSTLLPSPEKQKEYYVSALAELSNPKSSQYSALLQALFDPGAKFSFDNRQDDFTYDNDNNDELQVWLTVVIRRLEEVFNRHGAVETYLPLLVPETTLFSAFPDLTPVRLLDENGKIVQLPSSNILAMARSATRRQIERIKRYHNGYNYKDHTAGGQPEVNGELR